jgi:hypothetical protein
LKTLTLVQLIRAVLVAELSSFFTACEILRNARLAFILIELVYWTFQRIENADDSNELTENMEQMESVTVAVAESNGFDCCGMNADWCVSPFSRYSVDVVQWIDKGLFDEILGSGRFQVANEYSLLQIDCFHLRLNTRICMKMKTINERFLIHSA